MLMAAGLMFLAGCKTEVMRDRHFPGGSPQDDPEMRQGAQPMRPMDGGTDVAPQSAPVENVNTPVQRGFRPMEGTYAGDGIEDETPRRRAPRKAQAVKLIDRDTAGSVYIVKPGDTLGRIARKYGVSVKALRDANNRTPAQDRFLRPGTKLVIPGGKAAAAPAARKGNKGAAAPRKNASKLNADGTYTMVRGDNIPKVARMFGIRAKALQRANNLTDEETTRLQIGHKLVIPTGEDAKIGSRKAPRKAARKAPAAPAKRTEKATQTPPPPPAVNDGNPNTPPPPPPVPATTGEDSAAVLPPPAPVAGADNAGTNFVPVAGSTSLEEFAAKNNTTVAEVIRLNPQIDRNTPIANYGMLYVPRTAN